MAAFLFSSNLSASIVETQEGSAIVITTPLKYF